MTTMTRRLDRIDEALWEHLELPPEQEATIRAVAARQGLDPDDLRAEVIRVARTYQGYTREEIAQALAHQEGCTAAELLTDAATIEREVNAW